ncbi:hypothetical protein Tco_1225526, partial [Tanacetum coccineum]
MLVTCLIAAIPDCLANKSSQLQADDEDATRRFRGTNHTLIMCKEIPNVPGPLQAGTGECHAP